MSRNLKPVLKVLKLEKPKASCCAYVFFAKDQRHKLQAEFPNESFQDLSKRLGQLWQNLSDEEREYYEELSLIDKSRFKEEKRVYRQQLYRRLSKALKDGLVQPSQVDKSILPTQKQPRAPFMFFARHVRPMLRLQPDADKSPGLGKPLSVMWNAMNKTQRRPFEQMSKEDVERAREDRLQEQEILARISQ